MMTGLLAALRKPSAVAFVQFLLLPFYWSVCGADTLLQGQAARRDPAGYLARAAADPRLVRAPAVREALGTLPAGRARRCGDGCEPGVPHAMRAGALAAARAGAGIDTYLRTRGQSTGLAAASGTTAAPGVSIPELETAWAGAEDQFRAGFKEADELLAGRIDPERAQRRAAARRHFEEQAARVRETLAAARASDGARRLALLADLRTLLAATNDARPEQPFDPKRPPFAVAAVRAPEPRLDFGPPGPAAASRVSVATGLTMAGAAAPAAAPGPEDLASGPEARITPQIAALAASLGHDPLAIFDWVYNNIDYYPTTGSVQGSQLTLDMRRGNAFDTAALLTALLRAAGIPARFIQGTIEVPAARVIGWVGNPASAEIAQEVLGAGGIPNVAIVDGAGQIQGFRIEHVWVAAWLDFVPSRGAVQLAGDTWVPLDAAFKQFTYTPPSDLLAQVPLDPVLAQAVAGGLVRVEEATGRADAIDTQALDAPLEQWTERLMDGLEAGAKPLIQVRAQDLLGSRTVIAAQSAAAAGTLPYTVKAQAAAVAALPAAQRHTVTISGYASAPERSLEQDEFAATLALPEIGTARIHLHFAPATPADAAILQAARDAGASALPLTGVDLVPQLLLDDDLIATGAPRPMGSNYFLRIGLAGPTGAADVDYDVIAGDESVIGVTGNGFTEAALAKRLADHPVDSTAEFLNQVRLHYWAEADLLNSRAAVGLRGFITRLPSVGLFATPLTVAYLFGQPTTGVYASRFMDVKRSFIGAAAPSQAERTALVKQAGFIGSFLEGTTFDQLDDSGDPRMRGVDAMKLLGLAAAQQIPLYRITPANRAAALPLLALPAGVQANIVAALDQGQTVWAPGSPLDTGPYTGVGYILQNESTGEGAYLIHQGLNGGGIWDCLEELAPVVIPVLAVVLVALAATLLVWVLAPALAPVLAGMGASAAGAWAAFLLMWRTLAPLAVAVP